MPAEPLEIYFCDHYDFPLPPGHKFPLQKYRMAREALQNDSRFLLSPASLATREDLLRVHDHNYVDGFLDGSIDPMLMRRVGFPWSPELVRRTLASTGSTLLAAARALDDGFSGTLAGGTHHAFRAEGSGFCVFNDLAVAAQWARHCRNIKRIAVVDLDVHQGDGTAAIFENEPAVFTLSLHGARNFPFRKQRSRLDIEFPDGTKGETYLPALRQALERIWDFSPELILFQAGVDALEEDRLGRLALTLADLAHRDRLVLTSAAQRQIPIAMTMGGGYTDPVSASVQAHVQAFQIASQVFG
jgi:acetoin utilization deacetylase AcuC-like enzyme